MFTKWFTIFVSLLFAPHLLAECPQVAADCVGEAMEQNQRLADELRVELEEHREKARTQMEELRGNVEANRRSLQGGTIRYTGCHQVLTACQHARGKNLEYLDRHHVTCGDEREVIRGFRFRTCDRRENLRFEITCCRASLSGEG